MASGQQLLTDFHRAFGLAISEYRPSRELLAFRKRLINEETKESFAELDRAQVAGLDDALRFALAKELADVLYVVYGAGVSFGIDLDRVLELVHESNMSKLDDEGNPIYDAGGKVLKGPNYQPPDPEALAEAAGVAIDVTADELHE